ncbi:hypothetical protein JCM21900_003189 [Sporobolomyces salmonicolor]
MSRRPVTPPTSDAYLRSLPASSFLVAAPPSTDDHHISAEPSYHSHTQAHGPPVHPSDIYSRPAAPSDVASSNFHWADDVSTIAPDDSVSQIDRRLTGRRPLTGPRPMDREGVSSVPEIPEEYALDESVHRDYVPPEMLEDDRSTVLGNRPKVASAGGAGMRAANPSTTVGPLARARGEGSGSATAVPYTPRQYANDQDDEDAHDRPLVAGAACGRSGGVSGVGSNNGRESNLHPYSRPAGYAAVGDKDDDYDDGGMYAAYSRSRDADLESKMGFDESRDLSAGSGGTGGSTLVGMLSTPLGYIKSIRGARTASRQESSFYTPHELAFQPPSSSSLDINGKGMSSYPPTSFGISSSLNLAKIPSLDVAGAHHRTPSQAVDGSQVRPKPLWQRWFWDTTDPNRRVWEHKRGVGIQRWPFAAWGLAVVMTIVLIVELVRMAHYTGSPIQTKPSFNVMIGPSGAVLINVGARFAGCMKYISNVTDIQWTCLEDSNKATLSSSDPTCTMSTICGFGGFDITSGAGGPDQSFRFFVPIFLHAGVVHLLLNMLAQCVSGAQVERMMGTPRFLILYLASGIFGFVLGANFALVGQPSVGASGAIFGTHAALLVDLFAHWKIEYQPKRKLLFLVIEIIVGLALGWVPGVDNFAHLGGFAMGLVVSLLLFPIVHPSRTHKRVFIALRLVALPLAIVMFVVLTRNFYSGDPSTACSWCRYLSCWPTSSNNHCKGTGLSLVTASSSSFFPSILTVLFSTFVLPLL